MEKLCDTCRLSATCSTTQLGRIQTCTHYQEIAPALAVVHDEPSKANKIAERELQSLVENELRRRGYYRRMSSDILSIHKAPRGWQYHHPQKRTKGMPYLLDILLLHNTGHHLEFELKVSPIRWAGDEQRTLCQVYGLPVFTTYDGAINHVKKWEARIEEVGCEREDGDAN